MHELGIETAWLDKKVYMFGRQLFMILGYCRARLLLLYRASHSSSELMLAHLPFVLTSRLICLFSRGCYIVCAW